ncbi:hypothetical protein F0L17_11355 [Streptomyces sp. TRM43335]|uniref:Uncharacterized protein n=1 Tax=Streptomyces taklimakanensis TaxID=2569853 RepID=A0A6G2BCT3_9ACTN|nr:hypothetical protein [Streptomyces taklimakanensis]
MLLACAALLGTVGGIAGGYTVQADRAPTPLPPLSQAELSYPDEPLAEGAGREPLTAEEDRRIKTDGDLRALLLNKPEGARKADLPAGQDGWARLPLYALDYERPDYAFESFLGRDVRRVAITGWEEGENRGVEISLMQFRSLHDHSARDYLEEQQASMEFDDHVGDEGTPLNGSGDHLYYVFDEPLREPGYLPVYQTRALARRGDIVMDVWIYDTEPISRQDIRSLAERQLERL